MAIDIYTHNISSYTHKLGQSEQVATNALVGHSVH
jgi:hypothetical protein